MSKHAKGKHTQPKAAAKREKKAQQKEAQQKETKEFQMPDGAAVVPETVSVEDAIELLAEKNEQRKKVAKRVGIVALAVVLFLAAVYFAGVALFSFLFMPNTYIGSMDLSFRTPEQVRADIESKVGDYEFKVVGNRLNFAITSEEAGLNIDSVAMTDAIAAGQDPWKWPVEVFEQRDVSAELTNSLSATGLSEVTQAAVDAVNATAEDPKDAYTAFDPALAQFAIVPEVQGTKLDFEAVLADILVGAMNLDPKVVITADDLVHPNVYRDDARLVAVTEKANGLIAADVKLNLGGTQAAEVDADEIATWVSITPEFDAVLNEAAMNEWATQLAKKFNTVGSRRTYTRPDGKSVTVSGGDYGWKVDSASLAGQLSQAVLAGQAVTLDVPVLQSGNGFSGLGAQDWGSRYVDVDLSQQHARFYDGGKVIWESPIVSGAPNDGRSTPQGVYDLNSKGKNVTLVGSDADHDGKPDYETKVTFWMPFKGNSIGFHDANWQSSFGGQRYRQGYGSHGCINLPYGKAESLYGVIKTGDVVVVHG